MGSERIDQRLTVTRQWLWGNTVTPSQTFLRRCQMKYIDLIQEMASTKSSADISLILLYRTILPMVHRCKNVTLQWDSLVPKYCSLLTCGARLCDVKLHDRFLPGWLAQEASVFAGSLLENRLKSCGQLFKSPNTVVLGGHGKAEKWRRIGCSDKAELCSSLLPKIQASGVTSHHKETSSEHRHLLHRKLCTRTLRPGGGTLASSAWHSLTRCTMVHLLSS